MVDAISGHSLNFIDALSSYNQIWMTLEDEKKTFFVTNLGHFYYRVMPFGLKNVSTTYNA